MTIPYIKTQVYFDDIATIEYDVYQTVKCLF